MSMREDDDDDEEEKEREGKRRTMGGRGSRFGWKRVEDDGGGETVNEGYCIRELVIATISPVRYLQGFPFA